MVEIKYTEEFLTQFEGRTLPVGVANRCKACGSEKDLEIVRSMSGADACHWLPGFCVDCGCGACGSFSVSRVGALLEWDKMCQEIE